MSRPPQSTGRASVVVACWWGTGATEALSATPSQRCIAWVLRALALLLTPRTEAGTARILCGGGGLPAGGLVQASLVRHRCGVRGLHPFLRRTLPLLSRPNLLPMVTSLHPHACSLCATPPHAVGGHLCVCLTAVPAGMAVHPTACIRLADFGISEMTRVELEGGGVTHWASTGRTSGGRKRGSRGRASDAQSPAAPLLLSATHAAVSPMAPTALLETGAVAGIWLLVCWEGVEWALLEAEAGPWLRA
jgi:hypothetical protein